MCLWLSASDTVDESESNDRFWSIRGICRKNRITQPHPFKEFHLVSVHMDPCQFKTIKLARIQTFKTDVKYEC